MLFPTSGMRYHLRQLVTIDSTKLLTLTHFEVPYESPYIGKQEKKPRIKFPKYMGDPLYCSVLKIVYHLTKRIQR